MTIPSCRNIGCTRPNLAGTLRARGDLDGAQTLQERVLEARTRILGPEHPGTLTSMNNLAATRYARGDLEGALQRFEQVHAVATRRFGAGHELSKAASSWVAEIRGEIETRPKP